MRLFSVFLFSYAAIGILSSKIFAGNTYEVTNASSLSTAIGSANLVSSATIKIESGSFITLDSALPVITCPSLIIEGNQSLLTGNLTYPLFVVSSVGSVTINELTMVDGALVGYNGNDANHALFSGGGSGGGSAMGAGLFVNTDSTVILNAVALNSNSVTGGYGGNGGAGNNQTDFKFSTVGGAEVVGYYTISGDSGLSGSGGDGGDETISGKDGSDGTAGGGGGGGGTTRGTTSGGIGSFGAGNGGIGYVPGGGGGGGGAALGGGIFINQGGTLILQDSNSTNSDSLNISENTCVAGFAGVALYGSGSAESVAEDGVALGPDIFILQGGTLEVQNNAYSLTLSNIGGWVASNSYTNFGLIVSGTKTLILTGTNTFYNGVSIESGGILQLGTSEDTSSVQLPPAANGGIVVAGTLIFDSSQTTSYAGEITGSGLIKCAGGGTVTLSGSCEVDVTLNSGSLLEIAQGGTYSGAINGNGRLIVGGTCDITGSSSIGSLVASSSTTDGTIILNDTLTISQSENTTFTGSITGSFDLIKNGSEYLNITENVSVEILQLNEGSFVLSGASACVTASEGVFVEGSSSALTYLVGAVTVSNPTSSDYPTINGDINLNGYAEFSGYCNVNGSINLASNSIGNIDSASVVSPGSSPGTISAQNVNFGEGNILRIYVDEGTSSHLVVSDTLSVDSGVTLLFKPEKTFFTQGHQYDFASYGAFSGSPFVVDMGSILLLGEVDYGVSEAIMTVTYQKLANIAQGDNAEQVAVVIDFLLEEGIVESDRQLQDLLASFIPLTANEISSALNQLQPSLFKGLTLSQENNAVKVQDALNFRMENVLNEKHCYNFAKENLSKSICEIEDQSFHVWADGFGDVLHQKSIFYSGSSQVGYQTKTGGVIVGIDRKLFNCLYVGALGAYTGSTTDWRQGNTKGSIDTGYGGLYASVLGEMFYGNASIIGGWSHFTGSRNMVLPDQNFTATSSHGGSQLLSHLDTGVNFGVKGITIRPFDSFEYIAQRESSFSESGAGSFDMTVEKSNAILIRNELGLQFASCFCFGDSKWTVSPKISWVREIRVKGSEYTTTLAAGGESFKVIGYFPDRSLVSPGVMVSGVILKDLLKVDLYYNGEFGQKYSDHNYGGQVRLGF